MRDQASEGIAGRQPGTLMGVGTDLYNEDGVDLTLIREFLDRSPSERLDLVDGYAQEIEALRLAFRATLAEIAKRR